MNVTLILVRHAKSDWSVDVPDELRPLADRGLRQAPATGGWLATSFPQLDRAVVSVAERARHTWELVAAELEDAPPAIASEEAYTFDGQDLANLIAEFPTTAITVALVGHNPALEELIWLASGKTIPMPTSALAVLELPSWGAVRDGGATVVAAGRPADSHWHLRLG